MNSVKLLSSLVALGMATACRGVDEPSGSSGEASVFTSTSSEEVQDPGAAPLVLKFRDSLGSSNPGPQALEGYGDPDTDIVVTGVVRRLKAPFIRSGSIGGDRYLAAVELDAPASIGAWRGKVIDFWYDEYALWFDAPRVSDRLTFEFSEDGSFIDMLPEPLYRPRAERSGWRFEPVESPLPFDVVPPE